MARKKYASPAVTMADVASWRSAILETHGLRTRIIWSNGADSNSWRVTSQAIAVVEGRSVVLAETYGVWPSRQASSVEALMLQLLASLERSAGEVLAKAAERVDHP